MIPYIIFLITIFILLCYVKKEKYTYIDFLVLGLIICFSGFRVGIGTDYGLYENIYNNINNPNTISVFRTGAGYYYLNVLCNNIIKINFQFFIFCISAITNSLIYFFVKKHSSNPGLSIFLYIYA